MHDGYSHSLESRDLWHFLADADSIGIKINMGEGAEVEKNFLQQWCKRPYPFFSKGDTGGEVLNSDPVCNMSVGCWR